MRIILPFSVFLLAAQILPSMYAQSTEASDGEKHAVFVMTNSVRGNEVIAFSRAKGGSLVERGHYPTGGRGSGGTTDPLGSQGSLTLSQDRSWLFAVNAGSGQISVFRVDGWDLALTQVIASGGSAPVAVAQHDDLVYVANFAGNSSVVGFRLDQGGTLTKIPNSIRYLSAANSGPSSLAFSPDGRFLLLTEKITNNIDVFSVKADGTLSKVKATPNPLPGIFDVVFSPEGVALVVQTGPSGSSPTSSISSYWVEEDGTLTPITASVPTLGAAACWIALTPDGRYTYIDNSASSTISAFHIGNSGVVTAVSGTLVASLPAGSINVDMAVSSDAKFVYTLNNGTGTIGIFAIQPNWTLKLTGLVPGLKAKLGVDGLAAY